MSPAFGMVSNDALASVPFFFKWLLVRLAHIYSRTGYRKHLSCTVLCRTSFSTEIDIPVEGLKV